MFKADFKKKKPVEVKNIKKDQNPYSLNKTSMQEKRRKVYLAQENETDTYQACLKSDKIIFKL